MKLRKQNNTELLRQSMEQFFSIQEYKSIIDFALQDIDLSDDVSADRNRIDLDNYPYLVQPLKSCVIQKGIRKEVVVVMPEQMGKTTIELVATLYNTVYNTLQIIFCYPSLQLAVQTSTVKFLPLFKKIDQFKEEIEKPFSIRSDRLKLSNAIIYWQGAGTKIVSKSCKMVVGDQCAVWNQPKGLNNLNQLKKRTRSYSECLQLFVSTPHYKEDNFFRQFLQGSQGYYYLRCQGCGKLTMRSADIHNLQFQTVYNDDLKQYIAVRGTQRLVCPVCKYEHIQADREKLIKQGGYVHKFPDRIKDRPSYQCSVLASLLNTHNWSAIADIQLSSGSHGTLQDYISFDNSIRGLPFQGRDYSKQDQEGLKRHYYKEIKKEDVQAIIVSADTQDTFSVCAVMALTKDMNYYVLQTCRPRFLFLQDDERKIINAENKRNGKAPEVTVLDLLDREYLGGIKPLCLFVDMRGHRSQQIKNFSKLRKNILLYAGTSLKFDKWKISDNNPKLFLCDAKKYQAQLIFMLYYQQNRQSNYLFLPETLEERDIEQITAVQPDKEKRNGNVFQNWLPINQKVHDMFDVIKQGLACFQICSKIYKPEKFLLGQAKILRNKKRLTNKPKKQAVQRNIIKQNWSY